MNYSIRIIMEPTSCIFVLLRSVMYMTSNFHSLPANCLTSSCRDCSCLMLWTHLALIRTCSMLCFKVIAMERCTRLAKNSSTSSAFSLLQNCQWRSLSVTPNGILSSRNLHCLKKKKQQEPHIENSMLCIVSYI